MKRMVERVAEKAKDIKDESLENVETAIDAIIAAIQKANASDDVMSGAAECWRRDWTKMQPRLKRATTQ